MVVSVSKHESRSKEIRLAIKRIEVGRPRKIDLKRKLSIAAVAEEVGISPSTIHTRYPEMANIIRAKMGRGSRAQTDLRTSVLRIEQEKTSALRKRVRELEGLLASLASNYAVALTELEKTKLIQASGNKVLRFPAR